LPKEHRPTISMRRMLMAPSAVRERSIGSVKILWLDRDYIFNQVHRALDTLRRDPNVLKVVLFGSFAQG
jgi:hypothetical protein